MKKNKINKVFYIAVIVILTICLLMISYFFKRSFYRLIESIKDFGLSIAFYFCKLFNIKNSIDLNVVNLSDYDLKTNYASTIFSFGSFINYFKCWKICFNTDSIFRYFGFLINFLTDFAKIFLILLPLFLMFLIIYHSYFSENERKANQDSKPLFCYKKISTYVLNPIIKWIKSLFAYISKHKWIVKIWIAILCVYFNLFTIIVEFIAFYFYFILSLNFLNVPFQIYKLILDLSTIFKHTPFSVWIILLFFIIGKIRKSIAYEILDHNEKKNKGYVNSMGQQSLVCGAPGTGKTKTLTDMALSQEQIFRTKAYEKILENDLKFPYFPFINLENELKKAIENHQVYNLATCKNWIREKRKLCCSFDETTKQEIITNKEKCFDYDYMKYGYLYYDGLKEIHLFDMLENYVQLYFVYIIESSLLVSNYGIREDNVLKDLGNFPIWNCDFFKRNKDFMSAYSRHSHILDFDMLRLGKKVLQDNINSNALEFGVIVITEGGKERGNSLDFKEMKKNSDEANQKNDLFNSWLKLCRHLATIDNYCFIKIFIDEQRPESLGADARELCEKIIFIKEIQRNKSTLFLFELDTLIYNLISSIFTKIYKNYRYYRSDNTLFMYVIKAIYAKYHNHYMYLKNTFGYDCAILESEKGTLDNNFDSNKYFLSYKKIYSNRYVTDCFSDFFSTKASLCPIGMSDFYCYENVRASLDELMYQNSYFINDITRNNFEIESK